MSSQDKSTYDDRLLTRYLLGALPTEESERLDELSVADDEMAARLNGVENDLVDSYARGELSGEDRAMLESSYLSSPRRRKKAVCSMSGAGPGALRCFWQKTERRDRSLVSISPLPTSRSPGRARVAQILVLRSAMPAACLTPTAVLMRL